MIQGIRDRGGQPSTGLKHLAANVSSLGREPGNQARLKYGKQEEEEEEEENII